MNKKEPYTTEIIKLQLIAGEAYDRDATALGIPGQNI
jgi:hypothetical protein